MYLFLNNISHTYRDILFPQFLYSRKSTNVHLNLVKIMAYVLIKMEGISADVCQDTQENIVKLICDKPVVKNVHIMLNALAPKVLRNVLANRNILEFIQIAQFVVLVCVKMEVFVFLGRDLTIVLALQVIQVSFEVFDCHSFLVLCFIFLFHWKKQQCLTV